jgi:hypothetical protein
VAVTPIGWLPFLRQLLGTRSALALHLRKHWFSYFHFGFHALYVQYLIVKLRRFVALLQLEKWMTWRLHTLCRDQIARLSLLASVLWLVKEYFAFLRNEVGVLYRRIVEAKSRRSTISFVACDA